MPSKPQSWYMTSPGDRITNGGDIEALASLAEELANFSVDDLEQMDGDDELEGDYDSITTDGDSGLSQEGDCLSPGIAASPGHDFALAVRTSSIISDYRSYLTQVESAATENRRLADEMESLRGSLGLEKVSQDPPDRSELLYRKIEVEEEVPPPTRTRYTHPLIHSRQFKRRFLGALTTIAVIGSIAVLTSKEVSSQKEKYKGPEWDPELAEKLREEEEAYVAWTQEQKVDNAAAQARARQSRMPSPRHDDENSQAMKMIQDMIAHPHDIQVTSQAREISPPTSGGKSGKRGESHAVNTNDSAPTSKSSKLFSSESSSSAKASKSKSKSTSKSAKAKITYLAEYSVSPPAPAHGHEIPDGSKNEALTSESNETQAVVDVSMTNSTSSTENISAKSKRSYVPRMSVLNGGDEDESLLHFEAASILYQAVTTKYNPMFFDRSQGWSGKSYGDMVEFCGSHYPSGDEGGDGVPCPYDAYCPEGPNTLPFGGYRTDLTGEGMFAPILDNVEHWLGWVQLSDGHPCTAYNYLDPSPTEEQTSYVMCCKDVMN